MKNKYDDMIIKYFSGLLDKEEEKKFEAEIEINTSLKTRYEELSTKIKNFRDLNPKEADTGYFINLIPRVREKLDARSVKRTPLFLKRALGLGLAAALLIFVFVQNGEDTENFDYGSVLSALENTNTEELNEFVELRYSDEQIYDDISEFDLDNYSDAINEQLAVNTEDLYSYSEYAFYGLQGVSEISESEENEIYKSLIDKKIL